MYSFQGIITKGGQRPNIIPGNTQLEYYIRCPTSAELKIFSEKVKKCAEAAAHGLVGLDVAAAAGVNPGEVSSVQFVDLEGTDANDLEMIVTTNDRLVVVDLGLL